MLIEHLSAAESEGLSFLTFYQYVVDIRMLNAMLYLWFDVLAKTGYLISRLVSNGYEFKHVLHLISPTS